MKVNTLFILLLCTAMTGIIGFIPAFDFFGQNLVRIAFLLLADISIISILAKAWFYKEPVLKKERVKKQDFLS